MRYFFVSETDFYFQNSWYRYFCPKKGHSVNDLGGIFGLIMV